MPYTEILLSLPESTRSNLLGPSEDVEQLQLQSSCKYDVISLPDQWHALGVATALADIVKKVGLGNFEQEHFDVMEAVARNQSDRDSEEDQRKWVSIFLEIKNYLYVGLCDEELCEIAANVLLKIFLWQFLQEEAIKSIDTLFHTLEMIYPRGPARCQEVVPKLLIAITDTGSEALVRAMAILAKSIRESQMMTKTSMNSTSPLNSFIQHVASRVDISQ